MKPRRRKELVRVLNVLLPLIEKCGGPGSGVPGPCPTNKPKDRKLPQVDFNYGMTQIKTWPSSDDLEEAMDEMGLAALSPRGVVKMLGIPNKSQVKISVNRDDSSIQVSWKNEYLGVEAIRTIGKSMFHGDRVIVSGDSMKISTPGTGLGVRLLHEMVKGVSKQGIDTIVIDAAGRKDSDNNGYYTWPRLGYDGTIPRSLKEKLPKEFSGFEKVSDLMKTPEGRSWWKDNGHGVEMEFDTREGSQSRKVLDAYVAEKGG